MGYGGLTQHHSKVRRSGLLSLLAVAAMLMALLVPAAGANAAVEYPGNWEFGLGTCGSSTGVATGYYQNGPGDPPLGVGSFGFSIPAIGAGYPQLRTTDLDGLHLRDLTALSFSTFDTANGPQAVAPFILLEIDQNGDGVVDDQLVFQPAAQATVQGTLWQTWDAMSGKWWSLHGLAGMGTNTAGKQLSSYLEAYPNARIVNADQNGGFRLAAGCVGSGWTSFDGSVDALTVGIGITSVVYDFESDGVHVSTSFTGDNQPGRPTFHNLTPEPFTTVAPGSVNISANVTSDDGITGVTMTVDDQDVTPDVVHGLAITDATVSATRTLSEGTHTVTMTATDSGGDAFTSQWDIVVSKNLGDNEWFNANGTPKSDQINATMKSLVEAFRYHLYGQSWDGQPHLDIPTTASTVTKAPPLGVWVDGTAFNEASTNATLTSLVEAFRWHFWGISWDGNAHPEMPTHANVVLPPQGISTWFTDDGVPIRENISATLQSLVEAFRWHFWGYSWDGQHHFADMPTHAY